MDFDSILFAKYLEGGGTHLELFFDQTVSTWDGQAGNNFYCTDYMSISKSPDKVVVEYDGTKYNCTKELDEEFGSYYYGAEYDAQNDTLDFSKYPFRAWFSDEDETLISLMAPDDQTHTFKIYEVKSGGGSSVEVESLSVTENGTYTAPSGKAYSPVSVNVQSPLQYGSPLVIACGSCNYFNNTLYLDYSNQNNNTRRSIWSKTGKGVPINYSNSVGPANRSLKTIPIPEGSTKVKLLCDYTCQVAILTYAISGTSATSKIEDSGWINITAGEILTYNFASASQNGNEMGLSFRIDSNNTPWFTVNMSTNVGGDVAIYDLTINYE